MSKLTGAALDRAVAKALGYKSVHNCERWVGLTDDERRILWEKNDDLYGDELTYVGAIEQALKDKNT